MMASEDPNSELLREVQDANIEGIKKALKKGANINYVDKSGRFALLISSSNDSFYYEVTKFLIKKLADVNLMNSDGVSALNACESKHQQKTMKLLLRKGARVNAVNKSGETALIVACRRAASVSYTNLLEQGAKINIQDNAGWSALMRACQHRYKEFGLVTNDLLLNGALVNHRNKEGRTALMIACSENANENKNVKALIDNGADIELRDIQGETALMHASRNQRTMECVQILIETKAKVNTQSNHGKTALMIACDEGHESTVKVLIDNGADVDLRDRQHQTALMQIARKKGREGCMELLINSGAGVDFQDRPGRSALMHACDMGHIEYVQLLIKKEADIDLQGIDGLSALMILCHDHITHPGIFRCLLERGANVNLQDQWRKTALMIASVKRNKAFVEELLEYEAQLDMQDSEGNTALILAFKIRYNLNLVELLIRKGADMNLKNKEGQNLLMIACTEESEQCVKLLLENGVETNLQDKKGLTALMIASKGGSDSIVELLLSNGQAGVDMKEHQGRTALMHSVLYKRRQLVEVLRLLIKHRANLDLQDNLGWSALMIACQNGHVEVCSMLLDKDANLSLRNMEGLTAFDIATSSKNRDLFSLFSKLRSDPSFPGILFSGGVTKESITAAEKEICLEDVGISLSIPKDALPSTDSPLDIQIQSCFSGSFQMPDNVKLVSPAYIVSPSRKVAFQKEVLVKIWHHANLETEEDCEDMVFLSASTSPQYRGDTPVYTFREIRGAKGSFRPGKEQPAGQIALKHFCILSLGKHMREGSDVDLPEFKRQMILPGTYLSTLIVEHAANNDHMPYIIHL